MKNSLKRLLPPIIVDAFRWLWQRSKLSRSVQFEYIPSGWEYLKTHPEVKGWNVVEILEAYKQKWPVYVTKVRSTGPLCFSPESATDGPADIYSQNTIMIFAYALALSAREKNRISILDWGGAIGHYYVLATALLPNVKIDYHCKDIPLMADYGQNLFPEAKFYSGNSCFDNKYDFVLASGALQYSQNWLSDFENLAQSAMNYLLVTRLPSVENSRSFVFIQRPVLYGYNTAYLAWCINKQELIDIARRLNFQLLREFIIGDYHSIANAPEQCQYYGFLFKKQE